MVSLNLTGSAIFLAWVCDKNYLCGQGGGARALAVRVD
jgi:hypothetical protein